MRKHINNIANRSLTLRLNKNWMPVGYSTVSKAIIDLVAGTVKALDIQYVIDDTGNPDLSKQPTMYPMTWEEWIYLPIRLWDLVIHSPKLTIRVPTITISNSFAKMPMKEWKGKPSLEAIRIRDAQVCQYSGKKLNNNDYCVDHVLPKSRGGSNDWTNLVLTSKELNTKKGNKLNSEIGLKLIKNPKKPLPVPVSRLIREVKHFDWNLFISQ